MYTFIKKKNLRFLLVSNMPGFFERPNSLGVLIGNIFLFKSLFLYRLSFLMNFFAMALSSDVHDLVKFKKRLIPPKYGNIAYVFH